MTDLLLIRHARPSSGEVDPPLSADGRAQARSLGQWLAMEHIDAIVTSPMARARETAEIAAQEMQMSIAADIKDLREWDKDYGADGHYVALEDLGAGNVRFEALRTGRYEDFVPAIDRGEFLERAQGAVDEIIDRWHGGRVAAFSHGGLINAALAAILDLEEDKQFFFVPEYTSVSTITVMPGGRRVVRGLNCAAHLEARREPIPAVSVASGPAS